jgi:transcriptional regulator GlxA family with amidase domain
MSRRRTSTEAARIALFREAADVIDADPSGAITLHTLAEQVSSSPRQLRRAFAEVGGTTFASYLRDVRMVRAARLLTETDLPVHKIAAAVGYTEPSQFAKAFRRSYGAAPRGYRAGRRD